MYEEWLLEEVKRIEEENKKSPGGKSNLTQPKMPNIKMPNIKMPKF